jgi:succinoglycan biosynthesis transport protein ExoP
MGVSRKSGGHRVFDNFIPKAPQLPPGGQDAQLMTAVPLEVLPAEAANAEDWSSLFEGARSLYRRKAVIALCLLAGAGLALWFSKTQPRMYESTASLEVQGVNDNFLNIRDISPSAPNAASPESYVETQAEMLQQDVVIQRAADAVNAAAWPEFHPAPGLWDKLRTSLGWNSQDAPRAPNLVKELKDNLKIRSNRDSRIVTIVFDAQDPQHAADFANALAKVFIEQSVDARREAAAQIKSWLKPQLDSQKTKVLDSEMALDAYARANGLMFTQGQQSLAEQKLQQIQDALSKAQDDRIAKQAEYEVSAQNPEGSTEDAALKDLDAKIADLKGQLAEQEAILTPDNYKVKKAQAQIDQLEKARRQQVAWNQLQAKNDFHAALAREATLTKLNAQQSSLVSGLSDKITRYNALKHDADTNRQFYESMLEKANEAGVAATVSQSNIRVAGPAQPAPEPYKPNTPLNLGVGMFAGLSLGIGLVLVQERANRRPRAPGDAGLSPQLQELGAIKKFEPSESLPRKLLGMGNGVHALERITFEQGRSEWSESFRATVASILWTKTGGDAPRVIVVTSALDGEGKTTVACNLAIALSEISKGALLIDADLRRPRVHTIFNLPNEFGFADVLSGRQVDDENALAAAIRKTPAPNLYALPAGRCPKSVFSLIYSERTSELLKRLRGQFEYVIVDAPPCLQFADSRLMARHADGAVLVVRANHAEKKTAMAAAQRLIFDGVQVLGTILNDWDPSNSGGGGHYGYKYNSKYRPYNVDEETTRVSS